MIYNINDFLTERDIIQINNTIKQNIIFKTFDINKNIIRCSYLQSRNLLLIYNNFNNYYDYFVLNIFNLISKDIILYLIYCNKLIIFFNYKENIYKMYNNGSYTSYTTKEISISINKNSKNIIIKKNNSKFIKKYKNNKIYMYLLYINNTYIYLYNIYYNKYNYKMYKKNAYLNLHRINFNIYKNILI